MTTAGGKAERDLTLLADEGLDFLRERTIFWDSLGPLPPPQVPKRSNMRERSFFMTNSDSQSSMGGVKVKTPRGAVTSEDEGGGGAGRLPPVKEATFTIDRPAGQEPTRKLPNLKRQKTNLAGKKTPRRGMRADDVMTGLDRDVSNVDFKFRSLQPSRSASRMDDGPGLDTMPILRDLTRTKTRAGRTMFVGFDDPAKDRKRELTKFINREMDVIDEAFKSGEYEDCKNKAEVCLRTVASLPGDDINKSEVMASLHSCLGNAFIALNDFERALTHHMHALEIGETEQLQEVVNRSLGHLGRMYIIQKRFNKALEVFARKAPAVVSAEEVAQVFHEIGNCFLALGHLDYARDCGKKALRAALEADIHYFKFQSWVLIAVAESRLKHHDEAYRAFEEALELAKSKDDEESVRVILFAMEHLSKTITSIMKKRVILSERLTSRSRTQTILDLNKRPHAARAKKKKKRLRRENTGLEGDGEGEEMAGMVTRQNTTLTKEVTWMDRQDFQLENQHGGEQRDGGDVDNSGVGWGGTGDGGGAGDGGGGPGVSPDGRGNSAMFEKSPRELEPFGDPAIRRQNKEKHRRQVHSRHGLLEHNVSGRGGAGSGTPGGSRRGSNSGIEEQRSGSRRPSLDQLEIPSRLEIPVTPRHAGGGGGKGEPHRLSPLNTRRASGDGGVAGRQEMTSSGSHHHDDSAVQEDGFLSQREEYFHPSKGAIHSHRGGFHSNRESRTDHHDGDQEWRTRPASEAESAHRGGGAKSRNVSMNMESVRETPLEDGRRRGGAEDQEQIGDITGVSSGPLPLNSRMSRLNDLSLTADHDVTQADESPRSCSNDVTPRYQKGMRNTSGRFTTESYYEDSGNVTATHVDPSVSVEHISVSRQQHHHQHRKNNNNNNNNNNPSYKVHSEKRVTQTGELHKITHGDQGRKVEEEKEEGEEEEEGEKRQDSSPREDAGVGNNAKSDDDDEEVRESHQKESSNTMALERHSSKVALRGKSKEEMVVTLETSKPYRVSSAASVRSGRSVGEGAEPVKGEELLQSPERSQVSGMTTGSGWEGDVSADNLEPRQAVKKDKEAKRKGRERKAEEGKSQPRGSSKRNTSDRKSGEGDTAEDAKSGSDRPATNYAQATGPPTETTLPSLQATEVKADVITKTTSGAEGVEHQQLVRDSREAYLDRRQAARRHRDGRSLDDIPSPSQSSNTHGHAPFNAMTSRPLPENDPDPAVSTSIPLSAVSGQETPEPTTTQ